MTGKPLLLRPLAQADIDAIFAYCRAEGGLSLARQFADQLEKTLVPSQHIRPSALAATRICWESLA